MTTLTLEWRPTKFVDVVGQRHITPILRAMVKEESLPPSLIFGGSRGTGKTSCARILAAALNCEQGDRGDACGECPSCKAVQATNSMSVLEVDAASTGGVDEVRKIREMCQYAHDGNWRVILLDEAHSMSNEAFNALLKILEEPPERTVFVLVTTEVDKILETVRSRAMQFEFRKLGINEIVERLAQIAESVGISATRGLLEEIASRVDGGMRDAVMLLDQVRRVGVEDEEGFRELFGIYDVSPELLKAALDSNIAEGVHIIEERYRLVGDASSITSDLALFIKDILVVKSGGHITRDIPKDFLDISTRSLVRVMSILWELKSRLRGFENDQRASLQMAFVLITEALHGEAKPPAQSKPAPEANRPMDLSEVRSLLS